MGGRDLREGTEEDDRGDLALALVLALAVVFSVVFALAAVLVLVVVLDRDPLPEPPSVRLAGERKGLLDSRKNLKISSWLTIVSQDVHGGAQ